MNELEMEELKDSILRILKVGILKPIKYNKAFSSLSFNKTTQEKKKMYKEAMINLKECGYINFDEELTTMFQNKQQDIDFINVRITEKGIAYYEANESAIQQS
ncbi:hypothetical protein QOZ84_11100 [Romboutsia sedimentorum]|uniref:Uncharacterized protein n=1 Tax=Romboutsia sedimentorum TaxID=1368474 RepID=A0ABT7EDC6_9FIRM|nr:hypothetical protein [Romboutsia sedimentorum]MDK2564098.1 hypothetical protein [Romboutsia sedimentorum]